MTNEAVANVVASTVANTETTQVQAQEHVEQVEAPNWGTDPMLKYLRNVGDSIVAGHELRGRVKQLEATIATMQTILNEREAERIELRTATRVAQDEAKAALSEMEQLRANLDYQKDLLGMLQKDHDELQAAHSMLKEDFAKACEERDTAVLDHQEAERQFSGLTEAHDKLSSELSTARAQWFKQEDDLQRQVRELTGERNSFEEKYRKCKSMAATIMALDQVRPEPVEPQYN